MVNTLYLSKNDFFSSSLRLFLENNDKWQGKIKLEEREQLLQLQVSASKAELKLLTLDEDVYGKSQLAQLQSEAQSLLITRCQEHRLNELHSEYPSLNILNNPKDPEVVLEKLEQLSQENQETVQLLAKKDISFLQNSKGNLFLQGSSFKVFELCAEVLIKVRGLVKFEQVYIYDLKSALKHKIANNKLLLLHIDQVQPSIIKSVSELLKKTSSNNVVVCIQDAMLGAEFRKQLSKLVVEDHLAPAPTKLQPLTSRKHEVPALLQNLVGTHLILTPIVMKIVSEYDFIGDFDELYSLVNYLKLSVGSGVVTDADLPQKLLDTHTSTATSSEPKWLVSLGYWLDKQPKAGIIKAQSLCEEFLIRKALSKSYGKKSEAAKLLNISRNTLALKCKHYDLT